MRIRPVLAACTTALAAVLLTVSLGSTAQAVRQPAAVQPQAASAAHPYSTPSWFPLPAGALYLDCVRSNPGCPVDHRHTDESMTLLTKTTANPKDYYHAPVYAAGSGIVHLGHVGIKTCPGPSDQPLGNWIWIDHGAGVSTRYAHLYSIQIHEGEYVTPRTLLGYSGNSGEAAAQCYILYLNFQLRHNTINGFGDGYPLTTSIACLKVQNHTVVTYPTALYPRYTGWNSVPKDTRIPPDDSQISGILCRPPGTPNTPVQPAAPTVSGAGSGKLVVRWTLPTTGPALAKVCVELQTSSGSFVQPAYRWLTVSGSSPTSYTYSGLSSHASYRARVVFNGGAGWSLESPWKSATAP